jgi:hypothetical protein
MSFINKNKTEEEKADAERIFGGSANLGPNLVERLFTPYEVSPSKLEQKSQYLKKTVGSTKNSTSNWVSPFQQRRSELSRYKEMINSSRAKNLERPKTVMDQETNNPEPPNYISQTEIEQKKMIR